MQLSEDPIYTAPLFALISCRDARTLSLLNRALCRYRIHGHICQSDPVNALQRRKVDLFFVDLDDAHNAWFGDFAHVVTYSNGIIVIAISRSRDVLRDIGNKHVHFNLLKPLVAGLADKTIQDACDILQKERRPASRYVISIPVSAALLDKEKERPLCNVVLKNVSYTGAGLQSSQILPIGELLSVRFEFPEINRPFQTIARVIWSDSHGQCGVEFQYVCPEHVNALREWLRMKLSEHSGQPSSPAASPEATLET